MSSSGRNRKEIFLHGDEDTNRKKIVIEDDGKPKKIVFEENGKVTKTIFEGDSDDENPRQTIIIREGGGDKPKGWGVVKMALAAIPWVAGAGFLVYQNRPQDPILDIKNITLSGFDLHLSKESMLLAVLDVDLTLFVRIVNPNIAPITFDTTILDIYYKGSILGQAKLYPGDQAARSEQMLELPCKLNGLEATHHLQDLLGDVAKRVMVLHARATINGNIAVLRYRHHFEVYLQSEIKVDPIFLDVIDQRHRADLYIEGVEVPKLMDKD
ncbi:hypothetical protein M758_7G023700 [Ceratodon purpureus]|uniref:Late embryogenesis abundant protein LEA-2 subgroup domain-containing protein n=1 Tax=Ceratodon purpureus TaxID=3225 RepID=A0A8T0H6C2_CERPU|nr:hypothetical protein KC19_N042400 [Ceratodon purpureus]KAG0565934.1 hypothetical protein KC19_7G024600 [Ceratodon purpureus]KAG0609918.1 hypothetical protein M758_7G023700 [Ceratodon purpureus]